MCSTQSNDDIRATKKAIGEMVSFPKFYRVHQKREGGFVCGKVKNYNGTKRFISYVHNGQPSVVIENDKNLGEFNMRWYEYCN